MENTKTKTLCNCLTPAGLLFLQPIKRNNKMKKRIWYHIYSKETEKEELYIDDYKKAIKHAKRLISDGLKKVVVAKCLNEYEDSPEDIILDMQK